MKMKIWNAALCTAVLLCSKDVISQQQGNARLETLLNEKNLSKLKSDLQKLGKGSEADLKLLIDYYNKRDSQKADSLINVAIKRYPKGTYAGVSAYNAIMGETDPVKMEALAEVYKKQYPQDNYDNINHSLAYVYANSKKSVEKVTYYVDQVESPLLRVMTVTLAVDFIKNYDLPKAQILVARELESLKILLDPNDPRVKTGDPNADPKRSYYNLVKLNGQLLMQEGKNDEAFTFIESAYKNLSKKDNNLTKEYAYLLILRGKDAEALPLLSEIVRAGEGNEKTKQQLASIYSKMNPGKDWILRFDLCQSFRSDGASYYGLNDATLVV